MRQRFIWRAKIYELADRALLIAKYDLMKRMKSINPTEEGFLLSAARVVTPTGVMDKASVLIERGRVARIFGDGEAAPPARETFDLRKATLLPGFLDVHIHGATGVDTMEASTDDLHRVARFLARHGVTAWLPTFVPAPDEDYLREARAISQLIIEQDARPEAEARALGVHYEGPFVNRAQCGALRTQYFRSFKGARDLDFLARVEGAESKVTHMMTLAPEIEGGIELVRELHKRGWIVAIGHTRAELDVLNEALAAGAHHMTHFMNAMAPLHHRAPGPIGWGLVRDDVTCDVIADGVHVDPLMLKLALRCKTRERLLLISDAVAPAGLGDGEFNVWDETITVKDGRTNNARGHIAGSVITMHDAVRMMMRLDAPIQDVARMASLNPARLLKVDKDYGSIEEGKRADLVALDEAGNVRLTLIGGVLAFDSRAVKTSAPV